MQLFKENNVKHTGGFILSVFGQSPQQALSRINQFLLLMALNRMISEDSPLAKQLKALGFSKPLPMDKFISFNQADLPAATLEVLQQLILQSDVETLLAQIEKARGLTGEDAEKLKKIKIDAQPFSGELNPGCCKALQSMMRGTAMLAKHSSASSSQPSLSSLSLPVSAAPLPAAKNKKQKRSLSPEDSKKKAKTGSAPKSSSSSSSSSSSASTSALASQPELEEDVSATNYAVPEYVKKYKSAFDVMLAYPAKNQRGLRIKALTDILINTLKRLEKQPTAALADLTFPRDKMWTSEGASLSLLNHLSEKSLRELAFLISKEDIENSLPKVGGFKTSAKKSTWFNLIDQGKYIDKSQDSNLVCDSLKPLKPGESPPPFSNFLTTSSSTMYLCFDTGKLTVFYYDDFPREDVYSVEISNAKKITAIKECYDGIAVRQAKAKSIQNAIRKITALVFETDNNPRTAFYYRVWNAISRFRLKAKTVAGFSPTVSAETTRALQNWINSSSLKAGAVAKAKAGTPTAAVSSSQSSALSSVSSSSSSSSSLAAPAPTTVAVSSSQSSAVLLGSSASSSSSRLVVPAPTAVPSPQSSAVLLGSSSSSSSSRFIAPAPVVFPPSKRLATTHSLSSLSSAQRSAVPASDWKLPTYASSHSSLLSDFLPPDADHPMPAVSHLGSVFRLSELPIILSSHLRSAGHGEIISSQDLAIKIIEVLQINRPWYQTSVEAIKLKTFLLSKLDLDCELALALIKEAKKQRVKTTELVILRALIEKKYGEILGLLYASDATSFTQESWRFILNNLAAVDQLLPLFDQDNTSPGFILALLECADTRNLLIEILMENQGLKQLTILLNRIDPDKISQGEFNETIRFCLAEYSWQSAQELMDFVTKVDHKRFSAETWNKLFEVSIDNEYWLVMAEYFTDNPEGSPVDYLSEWHDERLQTCLHKVAADPETPSWFVNLILSEEKIARLFKVDQQQKTPIDIAMDMENISFLKCAREVLQRNIFLKNRKLDTAAEHLRSVEMDLGMETPAYKRLILQIDAGKDGVKKSAELLAKLVDFFAFHRVIHGVPDSKSSVNSNGSSPAIFYPGKSPSDSSVATPSKWQMLAKQLEEALDQAPKEEREKEQEQEEEEELDLSMPPQHPVTDTGSKPVEGAREDEEMQQATPGEEENETHDHGL